MFDIGISEFALIALVALIALGPRDMSAAVRGLSKAVMLVKKATRSLMLKLQEYIEEEKHDG